MSAIPADLIPEEHRGTVRAAIMKAAGEGFDDLHSGSFGGLAASLNAGGVAQTTSFRTKDGHELRVTVALGAEDDD